MRIERTIDLAAVPDAVYEVIMDPTRLAEWVTIHDSLDDAPDGLLERGSKLTQRLHVAGRGFTVRWTVVENARPHHVVWDGHGPMQSRAGVTYELEPHDGGTRFTYTNEFALPGGPLGRIAEPVVRRATAGEVDRSLTRLRALVE